MFTGCMVALVTPFKDGAVDWDKLQELVEFHIAQGTDAIVPCGTTGESPTLSHDEHKEVVARVVKYAGGRCPVIAGTGSNSTVEAVALTRSAKESGADGALMVAPYYNKPTPEGQYLHFKRVADEVDIPIILYDIPSRTGITMLPETIARLRRDCANIVGLKEATGSLDHATTVLSLCDITLVSGDDSLTLPLLSVGGKGVISVMANIVPRDVKALISAYESGDVKLAAERHKKLFPLCKALFYETNPIPIKTAMRLLGRLNGELRLPLCPMQLSHEERLKKALEEYGLRQGSGRR